MELHSLFLNDTVHCDLGAGDVARLVVRVDKAGTHRIKTNTGATSPERESPTTIGSSGPVAGREGTGSGCGSNGGFCDVIKGPAQCPQLPGAG